MFAFVKKPIIFHLLIYTISIVSSNLSIIEIANQKEFPLIDYIVRNADRFLIGKSNTIGVTLALEKRKNRKKLGLVFETGDLLNGVIKELCASFKVIVDYQRFSVVNQARFNNILVVDSYNTFQRLFNEISEDVLDLRGYYMLVIPFDLKDGLSVSSKIFYDLWSRKLSNVVTIVKNATDYSVMTYFPFQPGKCENSLAQQIDQFAIDAPLTPTRDIFPPKLTDFHGCDLIVGTFNTPPFMSIETFKNGTSWTDGIDGTMLRVLSQKMNFTIKIQYPEDGEKWGIIDENGHSSGGMKTLMDRKANFSIGCYARTLFDNSVDNSLIYYFAYMIMLVPPGKPFTALETLFLPFRQNLWLLFFSMFAFGFTVIWTTQRFKHRNIDIVENHKTPCLNMISTFLGGSVTPTPNGKLARYLLALWICFCLVVRSVYQAKLFDHLQSPQTKSPVRSFKAAIEEDFHFYMGKEANIFFETMPKVLERSINIHGDIEDFVDELRDYKSKRGFVSTSAHTAYFNKMHGKNGSMHVIPRNIVLLPIAIIYPKHSALITPIDHKISQFLSGGFVEFWASHYSSSSYLSEKQEKKPPAPLTLENVLASFEILVLGYILSFAVFIGERSRFHRFFSTANGLKMCK